MTSNNLRPTKHYIDISLLDAVEVKKIVDLAHLVKNRKNKLTHVLSGKTLISLFEKSSTRTRVSFEVGINQLGGHNVVINSTDSQLKIGESLSDTAKILAGFSDIIMMRASKHSTILTMAKNSTVPIINGLSDYSHPCQIIADIITFEQYFGDIKDGTLTWIGDGNNVLNSWIHACEKLNFKLKISCPKEYMPCKKTLDFAIDGGANIFFTSDPKEAAKDSDAIITDTWISMGDLDKDRRLEIFKPYKINDEIMQVAKQNAIFMHCLPAHRDAEVTANVIDGSQSVVFEQAKNRLHAQKAIMVWCLNLENKLN